MTTATVLFANLAKSTLAGGISNVATTANLASGTGALFPSPSAGQFFVGTFTDAATGLLNEIVHVTGISGDVITMTRAQESTSALAWLAGDLFNNLCTAGTMQTLVQQSQATNYAADSGAVNAYVATFSPAVTTHVVGMPLRVKIANTNTAASTFNDGAGVVAVKRPDGTALQYQDLIAGGIYTFVWNGTAFGVPELAPSSGASTAGAMGQVKFAPVSVPNTNTATIISVSSSGANVPLQGLALVQFDYSTFGSLYPGTFFCDLLLCNGAVDPVVISSRTDAGSGAPGTRTYSHGTAGALTLALTGAVGGPITPSLSLISGVQ